MGAVDSPLTGWGLPDADETLLPLNFHTNALAASLVVKTGPGILYGLTVYNSKASAQFVQVHDSVGVPADGAVPVLTLTVAASSNLGIQWLPGRTFLYGIFVCNSSTAATKTIGAADLFVDAQFV